ncbi:phosphonate ABC transporter, permease protein PhnE [Rhodococcus xishaensis]|uniref:Phosphonate ABC transporter, permease protein PhnE n=1 Tax=Rhodococcus xishaensis TaxID=2487364 RepID=A0A438ATT3_9NOCA|nr:phosphonate ABC transporter, permease protein PhnE [Rhodococcus xishaensis]RVW02002.1 phosphonate ABC transporter, permease protein PhnE [Rhodococcus xishaensis]
MSVDHKASPAAAPRPPSPQLESSGRRNLLWARNIVVVLLVLAFLGWSASDLGLSPQRFIQGIPRLVEFLLRMFPPDLTVIPGLWDAILTTVAVALWGTLLAMFISFFLALGAAKNLLGHNPFVYAASRTILSILRSLPDLIWALIFVAAVGLGPFPGVLALTVYSCGELSKLYAEAVENIDPGPREALESTGAGLFTTLRWSVIPQILPEVITYSLYRLESNVRHAFVLGMVGAGGLGFELSVSMRLFQYHKVSAILIVIIVTVATIDFISSRIRARVI